jgi:hypothetical protein
MVSHNESYDATLATDIIQRGFNFQRVAVYSTLEQSARFSYVRGLATVVRECGRSGLTASVKRAPPQRRCAGNESLYPIYERRRHPVGIRFHQEVQPTELVHAIKQSTRIALQRECTGVPFSELHLFTGV